MNSTTICIAAYLTVGALVAFAHTDIRGTLLQQWRDESLAFPSRLLIFCLCFLAVLVIWPIALVTRLRQPDRADLASVKKSFSKRHGYAPDSDAVLLTYRHVIERKFDAVAAERGERLSTDARRQICRHYLEFCAEADARNLGAGGLVLISEILTIYRNCGLPALLSKLAEQKPALE